MKNADPFLEAYLQILNEEKSPTTFTPEELLNDAVRECFYSTGEFVVYKIDQILGFCDDENKPLFSKLAKNLRYDDDYAMIIVYFPDPSKIDYIFSSHRYMLPHHHYGFSMDSVKEAFKKFFADERHIAANFNSIDACPELGCIIGLNGDKLKTRRDFEKELDREINHYFEQMKIHFKDARRSEPIELNEDVINELVDFYGISIEKKSFINDLKTHLFHEDEFRSMSVNVFHEILRHNEMHLKQLSADEVFDAIKSRQWRRFDDVRFQEALLFAWVCRSLSSSRWMILRDGIIEACSVKKNIFQKFFIKGRDKLREMILRLKKKS